MQVDAWLRLSLVPGLGPSKINKLLQRFLCPQAILNLDDSLLQQLPKSLSDPLRILKTNQQVASRLQRQLDYSCVWLDQPHHHLLTLADPNYPALLKQIPSPPPILFVVAESVNLLEDPQVAIVGSRKPTLGGQQVAYTFAKELAQAGITITSGLAIGVDGAAHQGCLAKGGATIAVLGCGCDLIYPKSHQKLAEKILVYQGALVSEFVPGTPVRAGHFPRRNRIISGLSLGLLVVEAARGSGSMISARCALEQNREVFAVPGSINSTLSQGCHDLIRQGAVLTEKTSDIIQTLKLPLTECCEMASTTNDRLKLSADLDKVLQKIGFDVCSVEALAASTGFEAEKITPLLFELEMAGLIEAIPGGVTRVLS